MAYILGLVGLSNTGKSYSRRTIPDGENVIIIAPNRKVAHLKTSQGKPIQPFDIKTDKYNSLQEALEGLNKAGLNFTQPWQVIDYWNRNLPAGKFTSENLKGNIIPIEDITHLPVWTEFVSKHLPWVHTLLLPDFTHFISREITETAFINRRAQGDAYQKFWELGAKTLRNFIINSEQLRHNLLVVTEYHAEYNEALDKYEIFVPAGKMLTEKFKPQTYYDILLFTHVERPKEATGRARYYFVTEAFGPYDLARCMGLFEANLIDNDLHAVLEKVREYVGIPSPYAVNK